MGPAFVHINRHTEDYRYFISQLKILVVAELPDAIRLKCKIHKHDNVKNKLWAMQIPSAAQNEILKDIFGEINDGILYRGLYHAKNEEDFNQKLCNIQQKWEHVAPGFHQWFQREQADTFKTSMIESVRRAAQIDEEFTMNPSESINEQLKAWVERERSSMTEFNNKFEALRAAQEAEAEKAIYGCGEYEIANNFKHLEVQPRARKQMPP